MSKSRMLSLVRNLQWREVDAGLAANPALLGYRDAKGRNWLHLCCSVDIERRKRKAEDSIRTAEVLIRHGLEINEPAFREGTWKATPLWFAIAFGPNLGLAGYLLEQGSDPNHCMWAAVNRDSPAAIRLLLEYGAEDPTDEEASLFLSAIQWNSFVAAEELLKLGADVNFRDAKGMTALHHLLKKGADKKYVRMLIGYGARVDIPNADGVTASQIMSRKRDPEYRAWAGTDVGAIG